ncbi:MAG: type II toxin-antitoxin system RelE/ParE family toxin [Magnetococcales bacterium]|nr:type II toxin-antitoxin system RelE/ParE family toxin [Magnetococcales bacterium]
MVDMILGTTFRNWLSGLKDRRAAMRIHARIDLIGLGNFGDAKFVRGGIFELQVDYGPGYRVYFIRRELATVVLLAGGVKSTQDADIARAIAIAREWSD